MGLGAGFGSFMSGFAGGYSFMSGAKDKKERKASDERVSENLSEMKKLEDGSTRQVAGPHPQANGVDLVGPPEPQTEKYMDWDKIQQLRADSMREIAKTHGPESALQLNALFAKEDERVTQKAAGELLSAARVGDTATMREAFNRTGIGGFLDGNPVGDPKTGYTFKIRGQDKPVTMTLPEIEKTISGAVLNLKDNLQIAYNERFLQMQADDKKADNARADRQLDQQKNYQDGMLRIYDDRNSINSDSNDIRASGIVDKNRRRLDKDEEKDLDTTYGKLATIKDPLTGAEKTDFHELAAMKDIHRGFVARGIDPDRAKAFTADFIEKARAESGKDIAAYRKKLQAFSDMAAGRMPQQNGVNKNEAAPAAQQPSPPAAQQPAQPTAALGTKEAIEPQQAPADPLSGLGGQKAGEMRASLIRERERIMKQPQLEPVKRRLAEINVLLDRLDRRDY